MTFPSYLLLAMGLLGAADIVFFHTLAHRLHAQPFARAELVTHFLRGPTYAFLFALVPNASFHGAWCGVLLAVLGFDAAISVADFWLEPASRRPLGGLPRGEYLLHVVLAMLFGALVVGVVNALDGRWSEPTELRFGASDAPLWLRGLLSVMAPIVLASGLSDLAAVRRLARSPR